MRVAAILLIAGNSSRFNSSTPKQMFLLKGKPVFEYALNAFVKNKNIDDVILVINKSIKNIEARIKSDKVKIVMGGKTRQESVSNALNTLEYKNSDIVLIHDGARPLIDDKIIKNVIDGAKKYGAVTTAIPVEDTITRISSTDTIRKFVRRDSLARIQTPQGFKFKIIKEAHKNARHLSATDDCSLVKSLDYSVKIIPGSKKLLKITTIEDIKILEGMI